MVKSCPLCLQGQFDIFTSERHLKIMNMSLLSEYRHYFGKRMKKIVHLFNFDDILFVELNYISDVPRPDVTHVCNAIARRLQNASKDSLRAAKRVVGSLMKSVNLCLENEHWHNLKCWELVIESDAILGDVSEDKINNSDGYFSHFNDS